MVELRVCHYHVVFTLDSRADVSVSWELNEAMGFKLNNSRHTSFGTEWSELKSKVLYQGRLIPVFKELKTIEDLKA